MSKQHAVNSNAEIAASESTNDATPNEDFVRDENSISQLDSSDSSQSPFALPDSTISHLVGESSTRNAASSAPNSPDDSGNRNSRKSKKQPNGASRRAALVDIGIRALFVVFLLALWQGAHYLMVTRPADASRGALFPSPIQTFQWLWGGFGLSYFTGNYEPPPGAPMPHNFLEVLKQADYPTSIGLSILRLLQGYGIAVCIGFPLGLLVARFPLAEKTIGWLAASLQSLPSVCWTPLALLWFGFISVTAPILFVTVMGALFSTVVSVSDGIANVPPLMSRAGRTLGATGPRLYFSVLLPAALPGIVSGLKVGWAFAWRSLMAAEIIVNSGGLGFLLQRDRDQSDAEGVVTTILVIIFIGLGVQALVFKPIERRLQNLWGLNPRG